MRPSPRSLWWRRALLAAIALGALAHARRYDFVCDDAFIALRYAKHLVEHHELAYNLGQRVEGFTSPLWVLLIAVAGFAGAPVLSAAHVLGGLSGLATFWALTVFWDELEPDAPWLALAPAGALALCAPFAAWIFGGLETPLFVATYTLGLSLLARAARIGEPRAWLHAGLAVALCTLCRPEGATLIVLGSALACVRSPTAREPFLPRILGWVWPILLLVGGYELFRLSYYGYPLPNTFYVKTSGDGLWQRGVTYLAFAASELGWPLVAGGALSLALLVVPNPLLSRTRVADSSRVLVIGAGVAATIHLLYVARVGGDFLDLYRFLAPLLPAAFCLMTRAASAAFWSCTGRARFAVLGVAAGLFAFHGQNQLALGQRALLVAEPSRAALRLEPLGWTRLYAQRWQGIGTWLARAKQPGDSTAVGAAGALPFFSDLPNLDLFGLNDAEIARNGQVIGNRPGHQRFTSMDYLFAQKPTFVFMSPESTPLRPSRLRSDRYWASHGYVPIEIRVDRELCDCPETFYHQFFVRRERVASLRSGDALSVSP